MSYRSTDEYESLLRHWEERGVELALAEVKYRRVRDQMYCFHETLNEKIDALRFAIEQALANDALDTLPETKAVLKKAWEEIK